MLLVLAVVFYLAMNNFKSVAPAAIEVQKHNAERKAGKPAASSSTTASTSASGDSWNPAPPSRPSLSTMDQKTSDHSADVQDALSQAN